MTTKHILLFIFLFSAFPFHKLQAQNLTFEDVAEIRLQDMGPIYQSEIVKGYFAFYYIDKAEEKSKANFKLILLDENLNKINEKKLVEPKELELKMAAYNGASLLFVFYNSRKETLEFRRYDLQLNQLSTQTRILGSIEKNFIESPYMNAQHIPFHIVSVDGKGFIFYNFSGLSGNKYIMQYFPESGEKGWKRETGNKDRLGAIPADLCSNNKVLLQNFMEMSTPSKYLQAIDLETGKVVFDKALNLEKHSIQIFHAYPDSVGNFTVVGQYYEEGDDILKSKSQGIFVGKINPQGDFIEHTYLSWEKDIAQKVKIDEEGRIDDRGFIFFRDAVHTKDGKLYLGGELYDVSRGSAGRGVRVQDFVVLEINADKTLNGVKIIDKKSKVLPIGGFALSKNPEKLANYVRLYGGFDYQYTQLGDDDNAFTFFYGFKEEKDSKTIENLASVSKHVGDKNYETDVIPLDSKADYYRVLPAKAGHLLFIEYFEKEKKLDMRIEKFNY